MRNKIMAQGGIRVTAIAVVAGMLVAVAGCGKEEEPVTSSGWESIDDGSVADTEAEEAPSGTDFATTSNEDATQIQVGRLMLEVPGYYMVEQDSDGSYHCEYYAGAEEGALIIVGTIEASGLTAEDFAGKKDAFAESMAESASGAEEDSITLIDSKTAEYMGMPGYSYDYDAMTDGVQSTVDLDVFLDSDDGLLYASLYVEVGEYDRDTATDYGNMMRNAQWAESSAETETSRGSDFATSTEENSASASSGSSDASGVDPDLKAALDSYESMMNSYCDFMERYQNASSSDALSMLGDYTKMLSQYTDAMSALSEIDQDSLDADDLAYYLDVTNRVTKRLLEVAQ